MYEKFSIVIADCGALCLLHLAVIFYLLLRFLRATAVPAGTAESAY